MLKRNIKCFLSTSKLEKGLTTAQKKEISFTSQAIIAEDTIKKKITTVKDNPPFRQLPLFSSLGLVGAPCWEVR